MPFHQTISAMRARVVSLAARCGMTSVALALTAVSIPVFADCKYTVNDQWNNGFTATVKITNSTTSPINNWSIAWQYAGNNRITNSWNANLTGANPYSATNLNWNGQIQPGQSVEFGFQGTKDASAAEVPVISGAACGATSSASSVKSSSSSVISSSSVKSSSSSVASSSSVKSSSSSSAVSSVVSSSISLSSSSQSSAASSIGAGVLFQENFENTALNAQPANWDNFLAWNYNTSNQPGASTFALVDSAKAYSGSKSIHFKGSLAQIVRKLPAGTNHLHIRAYVNMSKKLGNDPTDNHEHIMGIKKTQDANNEIRVGQIKGVLGTNEVPSDNIAPKMDKWYGGTELSPNKWYCVETAMYGDTAYNQLHMWVDGKLVHSITSANDWNNGALPANWLSDKFNYVMFGFHSFSGNTADVWMDDIVVSTQPIGCGSASSSSVATSSSSQSSVVTSISSSSKSSQVSSAISSTTSSSVSSQSSSKSSSSSSSVPVVGVGNWTLDPTNSFINFVTIKNVNKMETHRFDTLSGAIADNGVATFTINLASVNTANTVRDQRMRDMLFQTTNYATATATVNLTATTISAIPVGQSAMVDISGTLNLHGVTGTVTTKVNVQRLTATKILVQNQTPLFVKAADYTLDSGVEALRSIASLTSISTTVPVDFVLIYNAN